MNNAKPVFGRRGESAFLYVSDLSPDAGRDAIAEIARISRGRNEAKGITGLLMFDGCSFAQWLEGPVEPMDRLLSRLRADRRHVRMEVLWFESPGLGRRFPHWHFGYLDVRRASQGIGRLRGMRGVNAMLFFGELSRGLAFDQRFSSVRRPAAAAAGGPPLLQARGGGLRARGLLAQ